MAVGYGQFGAPNYFGRDIPPNILNQYPGTTNIQAGGQAFGNLLYGPLSNAYNITAAQAADPSAVAFQADMARGGGAFAVPGAGTAQLSNLFAGQAQADVAGQQAKFQQQKSAEQGMLDTAQAYAGDIYQTQQAKYGLEAAKGQQQQQQEQGIVGLLDMFTNPNSMLGNILGQGGTGTLGKGQSPFGGLWQYAMGGSGALSPLAALTATTPGLAESGLGAADLSGIFASMAEYAPELAAFTVA